MAIQPTQNPIVPICYRCYRREDEIYAKLKKCSKCFTAYYCSEHCQKKDWDIHKRLCNISTPEIETPLHQWCLKVLDERSAEMFFLFRTIAFVEKCFLAIVVPEDTMLAVPRQCEDFFSLTQFFMSEEKQQTWFKQVDRCPTDRCIPVLFAEGFFPRLYLVSSKNYSPLYKAMNGMCQEQLISIWLLKEEGNKEYECEEALQKKSPHQTVRAERKQRRNRSAKGRS